MLSCFTLNLVKTLLPPANEVWDKVIFLYLCVILFTAGSASRGCVWRGGICIPGGYPQILRNTVKEQVVHIILECILVCNIFFLLSVALLAVCVWEPIVVSSKRLYFSKGQGLTKISTVIPSNVEEVMIVHNKISRVRMNMFENLTQCRSLDLHHNIITTIKKRAFNGLRNLEMLDLENNVISYIKPGAFIGLDKLEGLILSKNEITEISESMWPKGLPSLQVLSLDRNKISQKSPNAFINLHSLKSVSLSNNQINIPSPQWINSFSKLEALDLHGNQITSIPDACFQGMTYLKYLRLSRNNPTNPTNPTNFWTGLVNLESLN